MSSHHRDHHGILGDIRGDERNDVLGDLQFLEIDDGDVELLADGIDDLLLGKHPQLDDDLAEFVAIFLLLREGTKEVLLRQLLRIKEQLTKSLTHPSHS
ncbi:MAG: hypothetical protein A4E60_03405 [Syntrophorhabdus sp. PtaB.Bin047]|nr:MAG: hypothetical protein A4E60_03405 [Syntrophorhabdus sp. PtaB.Bin047]